MGWERLRGHIEARMPVGAQIDEGLMAKLDGLLAQLPRSARSVSYELYKVETKRSFDPARALVARRVLEQLDRCIQGSDRELVHLFGMLGRYMGPAECAPIVRRLIKHPDLRVRRQAEALMTARPPDEVALPGEGDWDATGWRHGAEVGRLQAHATGARPQQDAGVPPIPDIAALRHLLGISSTAQLGYLLLASDANKGPYSRFSIPKRDGGQRVICAPRPLLKTIQRRILTRILAPVPIHDAAHGFIEGRSTVTNASAHVGRALVVKFDLKDFFPTIHYRRVIGLFASLGYTLGELRFSNDDASQAVAPTLARLVTWAEDSSSYFDGALPQGAPTSPALSNLVCRGLDARLSGLAASVGGTYTRYADDLTFSFDAEPDKGLGRLRWWVDQICQQEGFTVRQDKFRVLRRGRRQKVTGIVVNDTMRVPRGQRRRIRAILHNCHKNGIEAEARGRASFVPWLQGQIAYIHMVHPDEGLALKQQFDALLARKAAPTP